MVNSISLSNRLVASMPLLGEPFRRTVIYVCEHHAQGTVGLIINRPMQYPFSFIFDQLHITTINTNEVQNNRPLLFGGPIQPERGFVIHRPMGGWRSSVALHKDVTITTSNDIIHAIAANEGPKDVLITLGYASWGENQLEQEILNNSWLVCPCTPEIIYEVPFSERWEYAGASIGVKMNQLSGFAGHA